MRVVTGTGVGMHQAGAGGLICAMITRLTRPMKSGTCGGLEAMSQSCMVAARRRYRKRSISTSTTMCAADMATGKLLRQPDPPQSRKRSWTANGILRPGLTATLCRTQLSQRNFAVRARKNQKNKLQSSMLVAVCCCCLPLLLAVDSSRSVIN